MRKRLGRSGAIARSRFGLLPAIPLLALMAIVALPAPRAASDDTPAPPKPTAEEATFFENRIRPVLIENCISCHGKDAQMGGFRADSREALLKGGNGGTSLVPGDPDNSLLIKAVRHSGALKMPQGGKLKPEEIAALEAWVKMGAPWPVGGTVKMTGKGGSEQRLWSLQPVRRPVPPKVKNAARVRNPIDAFVLAKIEAKGLTPAPPLDRRSLLRRVSYDLIGLPPTAAEVDAFLADKSPDAYEKVVDRLLASPRYGERWARHWLDIARYADTKGYVFNEDRNYYNAYTYRDWVINALNDDLPYDQFIVRQLAADRLPEVRNGDDKRPLAALGFLTVGRRFLNQQPDIIDDRIDVTMRGFQGLTVGCARCHDHKFDPVPTQDYYSLYAIFASSQETTPPISEKRIRDPWERYSSDRAAAENGIREIIVAQVKRLREINRDTERRKTLSDEVKQVLQAVREEETPEGDRLAKLEKAFEEAERSRLNTLRRAIADLDQAKPPTPEFAMAMDDSPNPSDGHVFRRGNPGAPGEVAPRRFLLCLSKPGTERAHWKQGSGRLELANAIASKENPLTARVFVNRVWLHHFGAGIVRTPSDFGRKGEPPTHPELLDWLASYFMDNGWSIKKLHRLMVTSATYRQSPAVSPAVFNADPENRLWARAMRRRLDLEQMRDSLMLATGTLDTNTVGGKSVDLWERRKETPAFAPRRAVYGFVERQNLPGIFRTFDFASPDTTSAQRFRTTVPQQALFFMNSPFVVEQARLIAGRPDLRDAQDDAQRIRRLYRLLYGRMPDSEEVAAGLAYLKGDSAAPVASAEGVWQYGYGAYNEALQRVTAFTPLTHFTGDAYQVGREFPDKSLGYIVLNAAGGHPGQDAAHGAVRRWTAPTAMTLRIGGTLEHKGAMGDGVRGRIVSSRAGLLGQWVAHNRSERTEVAEVAVQKGETIDFVVDPQGGDAFDSFLWSPTLKTVDEKRNWNAARNFGPPAPPPVTRLTLYAQALLMTNEFLFAD
ncbi:MAG: DUF1553 domain-containing protein [Capsulimonadales bacterium]|nr:DUF1553 domain-containing protein [Capsulimonadales bacterium]